MTRLLFIAALALTPCHRAALEPDCSPGEREKRFICIRYNGGFCLEYADRMAKCGADGRWVKE